MKARKRMAREQLPVVTDVRVQKGEVIGVRENGERIVLARLVDKAAPLPPRTRVPRKRKEPLAPSPTEGNM